MKFNGFLMSLAEASSCENSKILYEFLGGEERLKIKYRTFRAMWSGSLRPSDRFLAELFPQVPNHLKKECLVCFFFDLDDDHAISDFLDLNLSVGFSQARESIWARRKHGTLSSAQLNVISRDPEYIRMYNRLACHSPVSLSGKISREMEILEDFVRIGVAKRIKEKWLLASTFFRLPHPEFSSLKDVDAANRFIFSHVPAFLAPATKGKMQEVGYSFHTCLLADAEKILQEMKNFKNWVQSFALKVDHPSEVTLVWLDFARILKLGEDY